MADDHMEDTEDTISLSGLLFGDNNISPQEVLSESSSSSSRSSFEHEFSGFFSEDWSHDTSHTTYNTSPENIFFCGKVLSSNPSISRVPKPDTSTRTTGLVRSSSDSYKFMKTATWQSTPRSKSLPNGPNRLLSSSSSCKSKWKVFMFGFGSGKYPTTMDMSDIKSRQLRRQNTVKSDVDGGLKKSWWRLVDVLGCSGGYERDTMVVIQ